MNRIVRPAAVVLALAAVGVPAPAADVDPPGVVLEGRDGPGKGKHLVLISGDQEYRSEETIPQLAKILATRHGFKCTVLFTTDPKTGTINPNIPNIEGLEALQTADALVLFTRFLDLPDAQMKPIVEYITAGKPVIGLRTATHAFQIPPGKTYSRFGYASRVKGYEGGFGQLVLGITWIDHHGAHGKEGTRGRLTDVGRRHPIMRGIADGEIFGPTDVYTATPPADSTILLLGEVTESLDPASHPVAGKKNNPMMPIAWTRTYRLPEETARPGKAFTTTMGASQDFANEGLRRMIVNACYWAVGLEDRIPEKSNVDLVGEYRPTPFRFKRPEEWKQSKATPADLFK